MAKFDLPEFPGLSGEIAALLGALQDGTRESRGEMEEPTLDEIVWQAYPRGHSIGGVLLHIASAEVYWIQQILARREVSAEEYARFMDDDTKQDLFEWMVPYREPLSFYYDMLDEVRAQSIKTILSLDDLDEARITPRGNEITPRWILAHLCQHEHYHMGQAVLMLAMQRLQDRG